MMTKSEKKKLIATNTALWVAGMLASFILPLVAESMTEGRVGFMKVMAFAFPLMVTMFLSTALISKAIGEPTG